MKYNRTRELVPGRCMGIRFVDEKPVKTKHRRGALAAIWWDTLECSECGGRASEVHCPPSDVRLRAERCAALRVERAQELARDLERLGELECDLDDLVDGSPKVQKYLRLREEVTRLREQTDHGLRYEAGEVIGEIVRFAGLPKIGAPPSHGGAGN